MEKRTKKVILLSLATIAVFTCAINTSDKTPLIVTVLVLLAAFVLGQAIGKTIIDPDDDLEL